MIGTDTANVALREILAKKTFATSSLPQTAEARAFWDELSAEVSEMVKRGIEVVPADEPSASTPPQSPTPRALSYREKLTFLLGPGRGWHADSDNPHVAGAKAAGGGEGKSGKSSLRPSKERAFTGKAGSGSEVKGAPSKLETGELGEHLATEYLKSLGFADARTLNEVGNNFPVDLVQDHEVYEVKAGLATNGSSAQQWRATIGQPGKEEREWLAKASPEAKARWNEKKAEAIMERKATAVREVGEKIGHSVKGKTMALIINHETRTVDVHVFSGFHARIAWKSDAAEKGYRGSYKY